MPTWPIISTEGGMFVRGWLAKVDQHRSGRILMALYCIPGNHRHQWQDGDFPLHQGNLPQGSRSRWQGGKADNIRWQPFVGSFPECCEREIKRATTQLNSSRISCHQQLEPLPSAQSESAKCEKLVSHRAHIFTERHPNWNRGRRYSRT